MRGNDGEAYFPIIQTKPMADVETLPGPFYEWDGGLTYRALIRRTDGKATWLGPLRTCYADALADARDAVEHAG